MRKASTKIVPLLILLNFQVVIAALVAVAAAKPGLWGNTVVAGPSGKSSLSER